jgi:hypothetical protein
MVMGTILFISGQSMNGALAAAGRAHRPMFEALGYELVEVDFSQAGADASLTNALQSQSIALVFGVMGMGADFRGTTPDGKESNLWQGLRIPYISLNGDSPAYYFDRHVMPSAWHACLYYYPDHYQLRRRYPKVPATLGVIPPIPFDLTSKSDIDFRRKEQGKLLFLKNGNDPEKLVRSWRDAMPEATFVMLADLASELAGNIASDLECDIDGHVTARFEEKGWDIGEFTNLRLFFVAQLDDYLRRIKSTMIGEVLADFPVEIHGFNWEHVDFSGKRATFVPGGDYLRSKDEMKGSLGIVDMSPNTHLAPHDRPMRAFGLYTLCLTNVQSYFTESFPDAATFTFRLDRDNLREKVADVLAHPKRYVELGIDVADKFRERHRPEDFGQYLLDTASHIRLGCGPRHPGLPNFFVWPPAKAG